jgi:hypothetical protein
MIRMMGGIPQISINVSQEQRIWFVMLYIIIVACKSTSLRRKSKFENGQSTYQILVSTINLEEE